MNGINVMVVVITTLQTEGGECRRVGKRTPYHLKCLPSLGSPSIAISVWGPQGNRLPEKNQVQEL